MIKFLLPRGVLSGEQPAGLTDGGGTRSPALRDLTGQPCSHILYILYYYILYIQVLYFRSGIGNVKRVSYMLL